MGLSICRDIVVRAGGELPLRSTLGKGTTMEVTLPVAVTSAPVEAAAPRLAGGRASSRPGAAPLRVLVVDDEPIIVRLVAKCLAPGAEVVVRDRVVARALERILAEPFDVIVCDVMMPGLTGIDLHERVARDRPEAAKRFLFMTGGTYTTRAREYLGGVHNRGSTSPSR